MGFFRQAREEARVLLQVQAGGHALGKLVGADQVDDRVDHVEAQDLVFPQSLHLVEHARLFLLDEQDRTGLELLALVVQVSGRRDAADHDAQDQNPEPLANGMETRLPVDPLAGGTVGGLAGLHCGIIVHKEVAGGEPRLAAGRMHRARWPRSPGTIYTTGSRAGWQGELPEALTTRFLLPSPRRPASTRTACRPSS